MRAPEFLIFAGWTNASDTAAIYKAGDAILSGLEWYAKSVKGDTDWVYLNYANKNQDPLKGYGQPNVAKLSAASKKYDPDQVFQKNVSGGFKVSRQPGY